MIFASLKSKRLTICHTIITRTVFCLENYLDSQAHNATHKITPALHTNISGELCLMCVIVLGNKAHEASITYSWVTRQKFQGELILVTMGRKTTDNYTEIVLGI